MSAEIIALLLAIIVGPLVAVGLMLWRQEVDRTYQRRLAVFHALLTYRRNWLSAEWVAALNLTLIEFNNYPQVLAAFDTLLNKFSDPAWTSSEQRRQRMILDTETAVCALLQHMAAALRIDVKAADLRNRNYAPKGWNIDSVRERQASEAMMQVLNGQRAIRINASPLPTGNERAPAPKQLRSSIDTPQT